MDDIDQNAYRLGQQLSSNPAGQMPQIPCPDPLDMESLAQLPDDCLHQTRHRHQHLHEQRVAILPHVRPQGGLKIDPVSSQRLLQPSAEVALISNEQPSNSLKQIKEGFSLIDICRSERKSGDASLPVNQQMTLKTVEGRAKELAEVGARKAADGNRQSVYQMRAILESAKLMGHAALQPLLPIPQISRLSSKRGAICQAREEVPPVPSEVFPNPLVGVDAQEFSDDFHGDDLRICEGRSKPPASESPLRHKLFHLIIQKTEDRDDEVFQRQHIPLSSERTAVLIEGIYVEFLYL